MYITLSYIVMSNAPDVAMDTAKFELFAANPAHADRFDTAPHVKGSLKKSYQWHCSLPWLGLEYRRTLQREHVSTLLYTVFLVVEPQPALPRSYSQLLSFPDVLKPQNPQDVISLK